MRRAVWRCLGGAWRSSSRICWTMARKGPSWGLETIRERLLSPLGTLLWVTTTKPVEASIPEEGTGQLDQAQEVLVLLVIANQDRPTLTQPSQCPLHHPAPRLVPPPPRLAPLLLGGRHDVRRVLLRGGHLPATGVVVVRIQAQVLRLLRRRLGPLDHDGLDRLAQQQVVVHVGRGDHRPQRAAVGVNQHAFLGALFPAIRGVFPHLFPPRTGPFPAGRLPPAIANPRPPARRTPGPAPPRCVA